MTTFFAISYENLNLMSFVFGAMWALCTGPFLRWHNWLVVCGYWICVSLFYAIQSGALKKYGI